MKSVTNFNLWLMTCLADANATAWMVYILVFAICKVWMIDPPHGLKDWLTAVVQTLYQGAALPLCAFVAKAEGEKSRQMIQETHDWMKENLALEKEENDLIKKLAEPEDQ